MKKTKKLVSLLLVLAMCASMAACGDNGSSAPNIGTGGSASDTAANTGSGTVSGPTDAQLSTLTDAYNQVAVLYNDVAIAAQTNGWTADQETDAAIQTIGNMLDPVGQALSGDMSALSGANFDTLPSALLELLPELEALSEKVVVPYGGDVTVITDEALVPLTKTFNELVPIYNEVYGLAEGNGWLADEQTALELQTANGMLTFINSALTEDQSLLEDVDLDAMVEQLQEFGPALEEIKKKVSVPYGNVG